MASSKAATIEGHTEKYLLSVAEREMKKKMEETTLFNNEEEEQRFPRFGFDELSIGRVLGRGGFAVVSEIKKVTLDPQNSNEEPRAEGNRLVQTRRYMASNYIRGERKEFRYALKELQDSVRTSNNASFFIDAVLGLAMEVKILAVLKHPHIIKMRAVSKASPYELDKAFFVVIDKLYDILAKRLKTTWKRRMPGPLSCFAQQRHKAFWVERLFVANQCCAALTFMHSQGVVYRDLKPDNIGFDIRGDVKIFDFGLCRQLPQSPSGDGTFKMTADTGSPRYMAPEVALKKPYNETCDCYSFCILLWQILKVETPFEVYKTKQQFDKRVVVEGIRPKIDKSWPEKLIECMEKGWGVDINERPTMSQISEAITDAVSQETGSEPEDACDKSGKSAVGTFVESSTTETTN